MQVEEDQRRAETGRKPILGFLAVDGPAGTGNQLAAALCDVRPLDRKYGCVPSTYCSAKRSSGLSKATESGREAHGTTKRASAIFGE